jgi:NAD(P)-dependent dehydrogenase (short-subunit alcohol dehydrogenase family)
MNGKKQTVDKEFCMTENSKTALIVGASRGLGLGLAQELISRGWNVIATERKNDPKSALRIYANQKNDNLRIEQVDINEADSIHNLQKNLVGTKLDILFVNAGIANDPSETAGQTSTEEFHRVMVTNALSPLKVIEALDELVTETGSIGVMSSGLGSVSDNTYGSYEIYRASKAALNTLMRSYAVRKGGQRSLFAISPGWVKTDMGGPEATLDVKTSTSGIIDTILSNQSPGMRFLDYQNQTVNW